MSLNVETFLTLPDLAKQIKTLRKADLVALAEHFEIGVTNKVKAEIKDLILQKFVDEGLVEPVAEKNEENSSTENDTSAKLKMQLEMKKLDIQLEREKMALERQRMEMEERIEIERIRAQQQTPQPQQDNRFDPARNIRLVPKFIEKSVDFLNLKRWLKT